MKKSIVAYAHYTGARVCLKLFVSADDQSKHGKPPIVLCTMHSVCRRCARLLIVVAAIHTSSIAARHRVRPAARRYGISITWNRNEQRLVRKKTDT